MSNSFVYNIEVELYCLMFKNKYMYWTACLKAKHVINIFPPLKEIEILINVYI
jgi:hypothetical protein